MDDEEWTDYEHEVKMVQKLPLKRKYKLSPNLASPNPVNQSKIDAMGHEKEPKEEIEKPLTRLKQAEPELPPLA